MGDRQKAALRGSKPLEMEEKATGRGPDEDEKDPAERVHPSDHDVLGALYDEYAARLLAYVRSLGAAPSLAEDILQEVFVKLARRLSIGGKVRRPRAYLFTAVRNEFYRWGTRILRRSEMAASDAKGFLEAA
ncbi:MAG: RNA polymerase sigma factor, partial [Planctomycetota bacterium]